MTVGTDGVEGCRNRQSLGGKVTHEYWQAGPAKPGSQTTPVSLVVGAGDGGRQYASAGAIARAKRPAAMATCTSTEGIMACVGVGGGCVLVSGRVRLVERDPGRRCAS